MEIAILHLTDIHFEEKNNFLEGKEINIFNAIKSETYGVLKVYIIITGDLINKGNTNAFKYFNKFIIRLKDIISENHESKIVIIPGNHDCNFSENDTVREVLINQISYELLGKKDNSVISQIIKVQDEFWENYKHFEIEPDNKLYYQIEDKIDKFNISFNCFNSSWMSEIEEKNNLFFPTKFFEDLNKPIIGDLNIALIHHPIVWFRPDGLVNNRKELAQFIEENNSLILFGHEHEEDHRKSIEFWSNRQTIYFSGKLLQEKEKINSGFNLIRINLESKYSLITYFEWKEELYVPINSRDFQLNGDIQSTRRFKSNLDFILELNKPKIPISLDHDLEVSLTDIFVFPDLEKRERKSSNKNLEELYDSEKLISDIIIKKCIVEGENQAGKSTLINMLYKKYIENDKYPLSLEAKNIKSLTIDTYLKHSFEKQYEHSEIIYQKFKQHKKEDKILLIDNFQDIAISPKLIKGLLEQLEMQFDKILIFCNSLLILVPQIEIEVRDLDTYTIKQLGYKKRNKLIENYHKLNPANFNDELLLDKTKDSFTKINQVLGNKLLPSYPIFILSILQSLTYFKSSGLEQTSYGHCYQSLIYIALAKKAKIENDNIDTYFNFLAGFSLFIYNKNSSFFVEKDLFDFYIIHSKEYHIPVSFDNLKNDLVNSGLVIILEDEWNFTYKYIYYFLVAKKIAELLNKDEGKLAVQFLCKNIHKEKNANILIFIAHHSKDDYLIQEATFTAMIPFEGIKPISLNRNGSFYNIVKDIADEICSNVIESNQNTILNREKLLEDRDNDERRKEFSANEDKEESYEELPETLTAFYQSFRSIEIVGQIIKNRKGSIPSSQLIDMIVELYNTAFRTISFFGINLSSAKEEFIESFLDEDSHNERKEDIKKKNQFLFSIYSVKCLLKCIW